MSRRFAPPTSNDGPLRARLSEAGWRVAIEEIAERHGLLPCELEPFARGETIVWRAGEHVIKLTAPAYSFQIDAEVQCLTATHGKLSVETPQVVAHGQLSGFPYVVMRRISGCPLEEVWSTLDATHRLRLARDLGVLCRELHAIEPRAFPGGWEAFWALVSSNVGARHAAYGGTAALLPKIDAFLAKVGALEQGELVPLHTELIDQHVYVEARGGQFELSGLLDFADARLGARAYEFSAPVEFIFKGERGLLRAFLLGYGVAAASLTPGYSEMLLAWSLCHRFANLERTLSWLAPPVPASLEELAAALYSVAPA